MIQSLSKELGKNSETQPLPHSLVGKVNKANRQSGYNMMRVTYHGGEYLVLCRQRRRRTWTQPGVREGSLELVTEGEEALTS